VTLRFRNVEVDPDAPLESWPYEAIVTLIERGSVTDWARLTEAIRAQPWGVVARQVQDYLAYEHPAGVAGLLERSIVRAQGSAERREKAAVAARVDELIRRSGLSTAEFASRIGTSRSRLSTYRNGVVTPSAALMVRMERLVDPP
jgi:DNA-binding transcriptional regulator YiaG